MDLGLSGDSEKAGGRTRRLRAARCRGQVAGNFFLRPEAWQREYRPLLAEWFVRRHRERVAELDRER